MKKNIHPKYKPLEIRIGDDIFNTMSTYQGTYLLMDVDYRKHPAWTGKGFGAASESNKNISTFNKKFGNLFKTPITIKVQSDITTFERKKKIKDFWYKQIN